ncbi:MAG: sarcosine oxidase subunit delta [Streptosporangiales bacterium]|nr:sarcosine oxidase subunit delta [Streptosporangiales bacterium]
MMLLRCPWCGPRNVTEFRYVGEKTSRPDPATTTPTQWRTYLYTRANVFGWTVETWYHSTGCRQHFSVERHTLSNRTRPVQENS